MPTYELDVENFS